MSRSARRSRQHCMARGAKPAEYPTRTSRFKFTQERSAICSTMRRPLPLCFLPKLRQPHFPCALGCHPVRNRHLSKYYRQVKAATIRKAQIAAIHQHHRPLTTALSLQRSNVSCKKAPLVEPLSKPTFLFGEKRPSSDALMGRLRFDNRTFLALSLPTLQGISDCRRIAKGCRSPHKPFQSAFGLRSFAKETAPLRIREQAFKSPRRASTELVPKFDSGQSKTRSDSTRSDSISYENSWKSLYIHSI